MSCYYSNRRNMLVLKCDVCGKTVDLFSGETDRLLKHDYMREKGWKVANVYDRWKDMCEECVKEALDARRERYFADRRTNGR